jgi:SAM-dependent methyltransferase
MTGSDTHHRRASGDSVPSDQARPTPQQLRAYTKVHPLYVDERLVGDVADWYLARGITVLQLFQFPGGERAHSEKVLSLIEPLPAAADLLDLGCGVGGMSNYWRERRPDLRFTLLNSSQAQLDRCVCEGRKICADAEGFIDPDRRYDVVVVAYFLGHVDAQKTLSSAAQNLKPGGKLLVCDVFDGTPRFDRELCYYSPRMDLLRFPLRCTLRIVGNIPLSDITRELMPWVADQATPALMVFQ